MNAIIVRAVSEFTVAVAKFAGDLLAHPNAEHTKTTFAEASKALEKFSNYHEFRDTSRFSAEERHLYEGAETLSVMLAACAIAMSGKPAQAVNVAKSMNALAKTIVGALPREAGIAAREEVIRHLRDRLAEYPEAPAIEAATRPVNAAFIEFSRGKGAKPDDLVLMMGKTAFFAGARFILSTFSKIDEDDIPAFHAAVLADFAAMDNEVRGAVVDIMSKDGEDALVALLNNVVNAAHVAP